MAFVELDRVTLRYEVSGSRDLPVLVFSNSLGANLSMWEPQLAALGGSFRILRYDTRGHGKSSVPPGPYTIENLGRDVLGLLDALEMRHVNFCGLSMGGVVAQWLGIHAAERIEKLVLANTAAKIGVEDLWNGRIDAVMRDGLDPVIPGTLERWFTPAFHAAHPETIRAMEAMLGAAGVEGYAACCAAIRDADFRAEIASIQAPSLIVSGTLDPVTPPREGEFLADNIAASSYLELPAAHLSNVEAAAAFNAALLGFLAQ